MALNDVLDKEIQENLSKDEKNFYGIDRALDEEENKTQSDFSRNVFRIIQSTLVGADKASIDELEQRNIRLNNLRKYTKQAGVGPTEEGIVLDSINKVQTAIQAQLASKKAFFARAKKIVSDSSVDVGALLIGIAGGDPLIGLGVKIAGDFLKSRKEKKVAAEEQKKATLREDAEALRPNTQPDKDKSDPFSPYGSPLMRDTKSPFGGGSGGGLDSDGSLLYILQDIFLFTEEISDDVKKLVQFADKDATNKSLNALDSVESSREGRGLVRDKDSGGTKKQGKGILGSLSDLLGGGSGGKGSLLMMIGKYGLMAGAAGAVLYGAYDIMQSYLKTGKFGDSDTEKFIQGLDKSLIDGIANLGAGAKAGAEAGSAVLPLGGTIVGALFGLMMDGVNSWLGDAVPDMGAANPFQAGLFGIFDFLMSTINGMFKSIFDMADSAVALLPENFGIRGAAMEQVNKARSAVLGMTEPLSASLTKDNKDAVNKDFDKQDAELDREFKTGTGRFSYEMVGDAEGAKEGSYANQKKISQVKRTKALAVANTIDQKAAAKPPTLPGGSGTSGAPGSPESAPKAVGSSSISGDTGKELLISAMNGAGITDPTERAAFMAQMSHESMGYTRLREMASGRAYEGRIKNLGNTEPGDGPRFKGRGFIQLTGRANYKEFGSRIGLDLENNPDWAADPKIAARVATEFWKARVKPRVKDFSNITASTKVINGGSNGLEDRQKRFAKTSQDTSITAVGNTNPSGPAVAPPTALASAASPASSGTLTQVAQAQQSVDQTNAAAATNVVYAPQTNNMMSGGGGNNGAPNATNIQCSTMGGSVTGACGV